LLKLYNAAGFLLRLMRIMLWEVVIGLVISHWTFGKKECRDIAVLRLYKVSG
jgi:hypothetical protein